MNIAILIIQAVTLLSIMALIEKVSNINWKHAQQPQPNSHHEIQNFKNGGVHTWVMVNVALFKMYNDLEILDYDSLQNRLVQTLEELSANGELLSEWNVKFNEYVQSQQEGPDVP